MSSVILQHKWSGTCHPVRQQLVMYEFDKNIITDGKKNVFSKC